MSTPAALVVGPDVHVTIAYSLFAEDEPVEEAELVTVSYVHGYGQVLPALEAGLAGLGEGAHRSVVASPEDAFGPHEADGVFELEKDGLVGAESLKVGEEVVASGPEGDVILRVLEIREGALLVDTNHPLAGKTVRFEVDVIALRQATEEEIADAEDELHDDGGCGCGEDHDHAMHRPDAHRPDVHHPGEADAGLIPLKTKPKSA